MATVATAAVTAVAAAAAPATPGGQCLAAATVLWPREVAVASPDRGHLAPPDSQLDSGDRLRWVLDADDVVGGAVPRP